MHWSWEDIPRMDIPMYEVSTKKKVFQIDFEKKKCKTNKDVTNKMFSAFLHSMPKLDFTIFLQNAMTSKKF